MAGSWPEAVIKVLKTPQVANLDFSQKLLDTGVALKRNTKPC